MKMKVRVTSQIARSCGALGLQLCILMKDFQDLDLFANKGVQALFLRAVVQA